jgi:hypothetical protein
MLNVVMLNVVMLNVAMLSVVMLSVIMLSVVMLSVVIFLSTFSMQPKPSFIQLFTSVNRNVWNKLECLSLVLSLVYCLRQRLEPTRVKNCQVIHPRVSHWPFTQTLD